MMRGCPVSNTCSGILRLVSKRLPGSVVRPRARPSLNSSGAALFGFQHDEAALGAAHLDRRIHHQREHIVQHAARAERAQAFEERGHVAQIADRRGGRRRGGHAGLIGQQEHELGAAAAADADGVAGFEHAFGDGLAVDVGAEARAAIAEHEAAALLDDLGVIARHFAAAETQIVGLPAANRERRAFRW